MFSLLEKKNYITMFYTFVSLVIISAVQSAPVSRLGGCSGTPYGCCQDGLMPCSNTNCTNCNTTTLLGGCSGTIHGCCQDGLMPCSDSNCTNCNMTIFNDTTMIPIAVS